jgi:hypothetical protein
MLVCDHLIKTIQHWQEIYSAYNEEEKKKKYSSCFFYPQIFCEGKCKILNCFMSAANILVTMRIRGVCHYSFVGFSVL